MSKRSDPPIEPVTAATSGSAPTAGKPLADLVAPVVLAPVDAAAQQAPQFRRALGLALAGHFALAALVLSGSAVPALIGAGGDIEAIGVEIVPATALESATLAAARAADARQAIDDTPGADRAVAQSEAAPDRAQADPKADLAKAEEADLRIPDWKKQFETPDPEALRLAIASAVSEQETTTEERRTEAVAAAAPSRAAAPQEATAEGGAQATGIDAGDAAAGRIKAAAGAALSNYNRELVAVLGTLQRQLQRSVARSSDRKSGSLKLRLTIEPDGRVGSLTIATSSGDAALDRRALAAVQSFSFPPPPGTATAAERTYLLPITYR
jgi:TonB family protein